MSERAIGGAYELEALMDLDSDEKQKIDPAGEAGDGRDCLTVDELRDAFGLLTAIDLKRLNRAGEMLARDIAMTGDELVSTSVYGALVGERHCPRNVPVMVFLKNTIRSLASSARKAEARSNVVPFPGGTPENENPIEYAADLAPNPEQALLQRGDAAKSEVAASDAVRSLNEHFSKDYEVQLCIAGMMEEMTGKDLREFVGVDQAGIDYARKKIYRATAKLFPRGWRNVRK